MHNILSLLIKAVLFLFLSFAFSLSLPIPRKSSVEHQVLQKKYFILKTFSEPLRVFAALLSQSGAIHLLDPADKKINCEIERLL